ncbi:LysR family transcriptional regulator [Caballeronia glebae]|uniref:LysR family transcriptional regulator n=1 Tax=Caballeronia glebae TaxID=1777143 RepID=A0A158A3M3_9BURK|nr:LysR family transcriptional regulator [Caballeronia glebae]SAK52353.1 LysR family transcriptional regulator [Caballeronia glebae]
MRYRSIDLNLLVVLDALLDDPSATRVAERLNVGQPAISAMLAKLRDHFGDPLLVQEGRKLVLSPVAIELKPAVHAWIERARTLTAAKPGFDAARAERRFSIACSEIVAGFLLPLVSSRLARDAPGISLEVRTFSAFRAARTPAIEALERHGLDFVVLPSIFTSAEHPRRPLLTAAYRCLVWRGNHAAFPRLDEVAFYRLPHIVPTLLDGSVATIESDDALIHRAQRERAVRTEHLLAIPFALANTSLVATLPSFVAERFAARQTHLRLVDCPIPLPPLSEVVQWRQNRENDPAYVWFKDLLLDCAKEIAPQA